MFKLNRQTKTKSGEVVIPFMVSGRDISAFDKNKQVKYFTLDDFDFEKKVSSKRIDPKNVVMVKGTPIERVEEEPLFNPNESGGLGGVYEEKPLVVAPPTIVTTPEETKPIIDIEVKTDDEIAFVSGGADTAFEPIQTIILSDTFDFTSFGRIKAKPFSTYFGEDFDFIEDGSVEAKIKINSDYSHTIVEENSGGYNYDDLYGGL